jgi:hypothetical protein
LRISSEKRAFPVKHVYFQQIFGSFVKTIFLGENQQFVCNGICDSWSLEYKCTRTIFMNNGVLFGNILSLLEKKSMGKVWKIV